MGGSGKWIRSLPGLKQSAGGGGGKGRKWSKLWRSSSASRSGAGNASATEMSKTSSAADAFSSVVAAVVRAPPRDFRMIRQEWAAVRIQTAFRAFLARRALRALRGIVRLQALVRGRVVRRQLAVTLKCMHALVRVQERAAERRARLSADSRDALDERSGRADSAKEAEVFVLTKKSKKSTQIINGRDALDERSGRVDSTKEAEEQWCDSQGSLDEVRSKIEMRHQGAMKRGRAITYALSHQPRSLNHCGRPTSPTVSLKNRGSSSRTNHSWGYLDGWMATKPWEGRLMEQSCSESQCFKSFEELNLAGSKVSDTSSVKIRKNNVTTRVAAKPHSVLSASSSDLVCDESSPSTSSVAPVSGTNLSERRSDDGHVGGPNYMSLTKSAKARLSGCSIHRALCQIQRQGCGDLTNYSRMAFSSIDAESNTGSEISVTSKRLNSMSLKGRSMTRSLDKENDDRPSSFF